MLWVKPFKYLKCDTFMVREMSKITLPEVIIKELRRRARGVGASIEEYLFDVLMSDEEPVECAERYLEGAEELVKEAQRELEERDLRQASEKIWEACALAIKAHALAKRGMKLESHRDLWKYKNEVAKELGEWVRAVFRQADSMHKNFYDDVATREDVEDTLKDVEKLVTTIVKALRTRKATDRSQGF